MKGKEIQFHVDSEFGMIHDESHENSFIFRSREIRNPYDASTGCESHCEIDILRFLKLLKECGVGFVPTL